MRDFLWWQQGIIYQIYPRSFMDADGDGVGDLKGITSRLDYLVRLGVTAVWISPIYPSPMADFGYDVADYTDVHPLFGTLADFDALVDAAHRRGLKVILDFVPNHCSDQHPWFLAARSSREDPRRDWFLWMDPAPDGGPPNNWLSVFGGSAWTFDEPTGQYYYHAFLKEQPDLNWRNPAVQRTMLDVLRFWYDRGVDGFRVDVMWHLIKDGAYRDNPPNPDFDPNRSGYQRLIPAFSTDQPEVHPIVSLMRQATDRYDARVLIGEVYLPVGRLVTYYGHNHSGAHLPFNFQLIVLPWNARRIAAAISEYEGALPPGAWPNWVLGNHDNARIASRLGPDQARVAALLLLTLRGTPTLYYGDEIGMHDVDIPPERFQDPQGRNDPKAGSRDPERTPMQWTDEPGAGFTTGTPWLPLPDDVDRINVAAQEADPDSLLHFYRRLIALRQAEPALYGGAYRPVVTGGYLLAYIREGAGERFLVVLNLGAGEAEFAPERLVVRGRVWFATHADRDGREIEQRLTLRGNEGLILHLAPDA